MIRKAIIPAAGKGTRLEPLTLSIPKEMIRVGKKPVLHHVIDNLKKIDIKEILIITGWKKGAILDYIGSGKRFDINAYYKVQDKQLGLGHAILEGENWVNGEDFIVIYGDNFIKPDSVLEKIVKFHEEKKSYATLVLHPVKDPTRFGLVKIDKGRKVLGMIEKPEKKEAENYVTNGEFLSISGIIILNSKIFEFLKNTKPGKNNEIQLTDAIEMMRKKKYPIYGFVFRGDRFDIGTWKSLEEADKLILNKKII